MPDPKFFRILAIDGGGIRGLIPARILTVLETKLQAAASDPTLRIGDCFDLIAGTSTGGILTCTYLVPQRENPARPRFSAPDAVDLYLENAARIFDLSFWQRAKSADGLLDELYPAAGLEATLHQYMGDLMLSDLVKPCLITAYDVTNRAALFFTQHDARTDPGSNFKLTDVARATSAAPTYFAAAQVVSASQVIYTLVDGGVFANNPALCAYAEARKLGSKPNASDMLILSLGTGDVKTQYSYQQVKNWGSLEWVKPVIDILMSGTVEVADYQLRKMFEAAGAPEQYLRLQSPLAPQNVALGNSDPENLHELVAIGQRTAELNAGALDKFVALLLAQK
jgi:patatin-like phospholipase/acyl hydrolase